MHSNRDALPQHLVDEAIAIGHAHGEHVMTRRGSRPRHNGPELRHVAQLVPISFDELRAPRIHLIETAELHESYRGGDVVHMDSLARAYHVVAPARAARPIAVSVPQKRVAV